MTPALPPDHQAAPPRDVTKVNDSKAISLLNIREKRRGPSRPPLFSLKLEPICYFPRRSACRRRAASEARPRGSRPTFRRQASHCSSRDGRGGACAATAFTRPLPHTVIHLYRACPLGGSPLGPCCRGPCKIAKRSHRTAALNGSYGAGQAC